MSSEVSGRSEIALVDVQQQERAMPKLRRRSRVEMVLFLLPALLFQLVWGWYPLLITFYMSLTDAQPMLPSQFTGLQSYVRVLNDPLVGQAFRVTFTYAIMSIVLTFVIPIIIAILLMEMPKRLMRWMMLLWFLPLSVISNAVLWRYLYNTQYGLFEYIATSILHLPIQPFLNSSNQVLFWLIFPGILLFGPGLIYMATVQSIPASYYEAAEVEGASFWRKIWTISLPRLRPVIALMLTFGIISSMQEFQWPTLMTGGQPEGASRTIVMYLYSYIENQRFSDATALSVLLFIVVLLIIIVFRFLVREDPDV